VLEVIKTIAMAIGFIVMIGGTLIGIAYGLWCLVGGIQVQ
jgi:hypothetical protein